MNTDILRRIEETKASVVIFDIDGTLKDLCMEHECALRRTLHENVVNTFRRNLVLKLNNIAMSMIKTGMFPTNGANQKLLIWVYSVLSGCDIKKFSKEYFKNYSREICLFEHVYELLDSLAGKKEVYFATINRQNYNLEECGISQGRIAYTTGVFKVTTYKALLKSIDVAKEQVIIVGDNVFDDILSAKLLGVKCLLVNNYKSKLKAVFYKLLKSK